MSGESTGYRGYALDILKKAEASIGDNIRVVRDGEAIEGVLIPRAEYGDERHVVVKIRTGYNVGIAVTPTTTVTVLGRGAKPKFIRPPVPARRENLPRVTIISTGGTIASKVDYRTGAVEPALSSEDLYSVVPELSEIANIETRLLYSEFSENITPKHWSEMAVMVAKEIEDGSEGVVLCHGTDTLGYTSSALSFALQDLPCPVVLVGSQRSSDRPSSDAASNLTAAVYAAARAPFAEVVVAMHENSSDDTIAVHRGTKVRKCHTSRRNAFESINTPILARVRARDLAIEMALEDFRVRNQSRKTVLMPNFDDRVALIKFYPSMNPEIISWTVDRGYRGIVLEGTGLGHVGRTLYGPIRKAIENGVVVGMSSQCIWGKVHMNVYYTGRDLLELGVLPLSDMLPETSLVKMMWALGQTSDQRHVREIMLTNLVSEFSLRRVGEQSTHE